jgi:hypothetical protein
MQSPSCMNFELITTGLNVNPLLDLIDANPELWGDITIRQSFPGSAHHDTECIFVLGPKGFTVADYFMDLSALDYPAVHKLMPGLIGVVQPVVKQLGVTELGRILIVRLQAGGVIDEHIDTGRYAEHYSRFHIALRTNPGCELVVGGEAQHMAAGEAWWFNHRKLHSGHNRGSEPRIHVIIDAVTPHYRVHVPQ